MSDNEEPKPRIVGCRSELLQGLDLSHVRAHGSSKAVTEILRATPGVTKDQLAAGEGAEIGPEQRAELISAVRGGAHLELEAPSVTYRQKDGSPNRNFLRFKPAKLSRIAKTFKGGLFLTDHASWRTSARQGTILGSSSFEQEDGWVAFRQILRVVKPDAVIGVLDGTIDRFSIGWLTDGAKVACTVHGGQVFVDCACWPGDSHKVDGEEKIVEYEWQNATGIEVSGVNVPAVTETEIEAIRSALAAEIRKPTSIQVPKELPIMADKTDTAVDSGRAAAESERDILKLRAEAAEGREKELRAQLDAGKVDREIALAYEAKKLVAKRDDKGARIIDPLEPLLRKLAAGALGIEGMKAQIEGLPERLSSTSVAEGAAGNAPERTEAVHAEEDKIRDGALASAAKQLRLKPADVRANNAALGGSKSALTELGDYTTPYGEDDLPAGHAIERLPGGAKKGA